MRVTVDCWCARIHAAASTVVHQICYPTHVTLETGIVQFAFPSFCISMTSY